MQLSSAIQAGDYITPCITGVPITLKYNQNGFLERAYFYFDQGRLQVVPDDIFGYMKVSDEFVKHINLEGGTSWVYCIWDLEESFYSDCFGKFPECVITKLCQTPFDSQLVTHVYGISMDSKCTVFKGASGIRQCLKVNGFKTIPGILAPAEPDMHNIDAMVKVSEFGHEFSSNLIQGYVYFRNSEAFYSSSDLYKYHVDKLQITMDQAGYVSGKLTCSTNETEHTRMQPRTIVFPYSSIVYYQIGKGTSIWCTRGKLVRSEDPVYTSDTIKCGVCGKLYKVPQRGNVCCDDPNCWSKLYPNVEQFCKVLGIPVMSYDRYKEIVSSHSIIAIADILDLPEYSNIRVNESAVNLLKSVIPISYRVSENCIRNFCNTCNNARTTILYYLQHSDKFMMEFESQTQTDRVSYSNLFEWFSDPCHVSEFIALLDHPHVTCQNIGKQYDFAKIFRNLNICITGQFAHGDTDTIIDILQAYGANVTKDMDNAAFLIVGDLQENIKGKLIRRANRLNKPIYTEYQFFNQYDIDSDLGINN